MYRVDGPRPIDPATYAHHYGPTAAAPMQHPHQAYPAADPAQAYLELGLEAERAKALQRGGTDAIEAAAGIRFKEVRADDVKYMDPGQRAEVNAVREALGADYEQRLRAEAGKVGVSKMAKRRHQIGRSLFVQAKHQELEALEKRTAG